MGTEICWGHALWQRYVHSYTHPHTQLKKSEIFLYPYPYPVNPKIFRQNGNIFKQYPHKRVYLSSPININLIAI